MNTAIDNRQCRAVLDKMANNRRITNSEMEYVERMGRREKFTDREREEIARFAKKYDSHN